MPLTSTLPALLASLPGTWHLAAEHGPDALWQSEFGTAWVLTPARARAEREGYARGAGHPARPRLLAEDAITRVYEPVGDPVTDPSAALCNWRPHSPFVTTAPLRSLLESVGAPRIDVGKALRRLGVSHAHVDRFLGTVMRVCSDHGPTLGGASREGLWHTADGARTVSLTWRDAQPHGWSALDFAPWDLAALHAEGLPEGRAADRAMRLCAFVLALHDGVRTGNAQRVRAMLETLVPERDPARVHVEIHGPTWLDARAWLPHGPAVSAALARAVSSSLDGSTLDEVRVHVACDPAVRPERGAPSAEADAARKRRLFRRWNDGIQVDEEGLISATPEALAHWLVEGLDGVVMDGTAGVGSVAIALAQHAAVTHVIAVDTHRERLAMARHNAGIYGVASRITFVHGDVIEALRAHRVDALVLDPPWGGTGYDKQRMTVDDLAMDLAPVLAAAPRRVRLKLPKSFVTASLAGVWSWAAAVDSRGSVKFVRAMRGD